MTQDNGGPAFPRPSTQYSHQAPLTTASGWYGGGAGGSTLHDPGHSGMSLRDWFAGQAMGHVISASARANGGWSNELVSETCYQLADAMLKARGGGS